MTDLALTDSERMAMENLTLKLTLIQRNAEQQAAPIAAAREDLGRAIGERLGIDMTAHTIDLDTGAIAPRNGHPGPQPVEDPAAHQNET